MRRQLTACTLAVSLLAGLGLCIMPAWAGKSIHQRERAQDTLSPALGRLRSFEVFGMPAQNFSANREDIPQDLVEYARTAIQSNDRLHYDSPAQGILHLYCANASCARIRAEVSEGEEGPVVWRTVMQYRLNPLIDFNFLPDGKKFANRLVNKLAEDYQQTLLQASSQKIQIKEE